VTRPVKIARSLWHSWATCCWTINSDYKLTFADCLFWQLIGNNYYTTWVHVQAHGTAPAGNVPVRDLPFQTVKTSITTSSISWWHHHRLAYWWLATELNSKLLSSGISTLLYFKLCSFHHETSNSSLYAHTRQRSSWQWLSVKRIITHTRAFSKLHSSHARATLSRIGLTSLRHTSIVQ